MINKLVSSFSTNSEPQLKLTLALIKPDIFGNVHSNLAIKKIILRNGFYFLKSKIVKFSLEDAERFYFEHKDKFFYTRLVTFMSSGHFSAHILAHSDAVQLWRKLIGFTKVYKSQYQDPNCIRSKYGLTDTRNAVHGSDSSISAHKEIKFFFPDFNIDDWFQYRQKYFFDSSQVYFVSQKCVHKSMIEDNKQKIH